jgi:hypothetical protein
MKANSEIVSEVRKRRDEISARFGHDLKKYGRHLLEAQGHYQDRVVSQVTVVPPRDPPENRDKK